MQFVELTGPGRTAEITCTTKTGTKTTHALAMNMLGPCRLLTEDEAKLAKLDLEPDEYGPRVYACLAPHWADLGWTIDG
jgi:hypothetical protein